MATQPLLQRDDVRISVMSLGRHMVTVTFRSTAAGKDLSAKKANALRERGRKEEK